MTPRVSPSAAGTPDRAGELSEIVLTGGPAGGKSSAKEYVTQRLADIGIRTFFRPEVATMVIGGGVPDIGALATRDPDRYYELQREILLFHRDMNARFRALAALFPHERRVIVHDRAEMDIIAYLDADPERARAKMGALLREAHLTLHDVRDSYEAVIHLVSCAEGAEWAYDIARSLNPARQEDAAQAREKDAHTLAAWVGHPHLRVIDNSTSFPAKLHRAFEAITRVIGIPTPLEIERKFLLEGIPPFDTLPELAGAQCIEIEQIYISGGGPGEQLRIRRRGQQAHATYYLTRKIGVASGVRHEVEKRITPSEYLKLSARRERGTQVVRKDRWCFVWANQYFELDVIHEPASRACVLLEIELTEQNDTVTLPPSLARAREVTDDGRYTNRVIAEG